MISVVYLHYILFRIHRKLKEIAVFRYNKKVSKEDGSVKTISSLT